MKPEHRFHSYVTAATVLVMFYFIQHVVPLLTFSPALDQFLKPGVSLLSALGIYKSLASLLLGTVRRWKWVKRLLLGASYMNGTWIGKFQTSAGETIYTVEHFEQTLSSLKIHGQAFHTDGSSYGYWDSVSETVDEVLGLLSYTYNCDKNSDKDSFQGIAVFHFERSDEKSAPSKLRGYSADLVDGQRTENREQKLSENLVRFDEALAEAKRV
jgi:hypothetical protein